MITSLTGRLQKIAISEKCVRTTEINYEATNTDNDSPRPGSPQKLTYRDINYIYNQVRVSPGVNNARLAELSKKKLLRSCVACAETIRNELKKRKIGLYAILKEPLLSVTDRSRQCKFCKDRYDRSVEDRIGL